jgi:glutamate dehydrogenase
MAHEALGYPGLAGPGLGIEGFLTTDDERAARLKIEQAGTILAGLRGDLPTDFTPQLYGRSAPEDLAVYSARDLAWLAGETYSFLMTRHWAKPKIRFENPLGPAGTERLKEVSILEIVNDNMPFLVDSVMNEIAEQGLVVKLVAHPVVTVERDTQGTLVGWRGEGAATGQALRESYMQIHLERIEDDARRAALVVTIEAILSDVRRAVTDWRPMLARVGDVIADLKANPPPLPVDEIAEAIQFLEWLVANNFTPLGMRDYVAMDDTGDLVPVAETGLGLLLQPDMRVLGRGGDQLAMTPQIRDFLKEKSALIITKANVRSRVHRSTHMDYIGVKRFAPDGRFIGEFRIVGLLTATAYNRPARTIPYIRRKIDTVMNWAGFDPDGHSGKVLANVLETYPRDELFQISDDLLYRHAMAIMQLAERPRVRVLKRRDRFDRYMSVIVYVPRDRYDTRVRILIGNYLAKVFGGHVAAFFPFFPDGPLTRVHYIIATPGHAPPEVDRTMLETAVADIVRTWRDGLTNALALAHDPATATRLAQTYREAFPVAYRETYGARDAISDIRILETLNGERRLAIDFLRRDRAIRDVAGLKVWSVGKPLALSNRVPVLENLGFRVIDETTHAVKPEGRGDTIWLHDMTLERAGGGIIDLEALVGRLDACLMAVMKGEAESDGYNALVLAAGLPWRDIALIRTLSRFLRQIRVPYSQDYMWATLNRHPDVAAKLVALFHMRFDPRLEVTAAERQARQDALRAEIEAALKQVAVLDEDLILRAFMGAITAALRTNFYQLAKDGGLKPTIAIKFESRRIEGVPEPKPLYEIFVYAPRVEGVHLRFGKVARGGLRWSDRPQDFRTEVLGLVKAQQVKNAVIVPEGAKGGFVPKQMPAGASREVVQAEGTAAYRIFVASLLDITDNLVNDEIVPPLNVVRHDDDDPYLVVAADKGTATFSDTANGIAAEYGFWLGDAFASGGSVGYDHKKMGITARGAWEAVKRHFREMDTDIQTEPFTVAGVGDMSGDVFGNAMLLSRQIRLVAAFDHRDIFIDPNPDPDATFLERRRLFDMARSSWQDFDKSRLSTGGGVFSRSAKEITLTPQARALLRIGKDVATPAEVLRAILRLKVDLLWFGGIGTYLRASDEADDKVGDRANDAIRVPASELGCKVIGEGANLGMTQAARIEAAMRGVRLNTDAIDNSGGVNTSDVEVNVKIALKAPEREGRLSVENRTAFLARMTDEVAALVLRNNYQQTLAISLTERHGMDDLGFQQRLMQNLEQRGLLNRAIEGLPDDMEIAARQREGKPLTRPELAVLLAYAKIVLFSDLMASSVPDDPYLARELGRYFPQQLAARFPDALQTHRLRREIIATQLSKSIVNRGGPAIIVRIGDQTGATPAAIATAFAAVRDSYEMPALNGRIDDLDGKVPGATQLDLYAVVQGLLIDRLVWFLRNADLAQGLQGVVDRHRAGLLELRQSLDAALPAEMRSALEARAVALTGRQVPAELAREVATLPVLAAAPDLVAIGESCGRRIGDVAAIFFVAGATFQLDRIKEAARAIMTTDYFDRLAIDRALDAISDAERRMTADMARTGKSGAAAVEAWVEPRAAQVEHIRRAVLDIAASGLTISKLTVAASLLGDLAKS